MFWKLIVSALLLPSCLGFETAAAHITSKVQNQSQSQESTLPVTSTLANQSLMNSSTLANEEDSSIQSNLEADTAQVKQTKYEYYQNIHQQRLRRYRQKVRSHSYRCHRQVRHHRRYNQNRVYYPQNHHPKRHHYRYQRQYQPQNYHRQHNYRCQYYSHGRCYN
ncbi:hypothetical protein OGM63_24580 [Plectonema radiosum NIES-515]|uniref:Uncharacterized protein n=1 Tax=Plectonema radiosum NIES-515 TaxID=2986073 RepID=A0ABT3B5H8_9CYAN|nr:hypothetical protein [Plectonema radiosum]MCV3216643.1 hypothetical protein [Plectonema radiosum NIES-515]